MSKKIINNFGIRIHDFIINFCKTFLDIKPSICEFEIFLKSLSQEQKINLLKKMKLYQLQMFAIKNSLWTSFANYIVKNKIEKKTSFQGLTFKKNEHFSYNSNNYKLTKFRIVLQQYLIETNKI
jgi:hypothetical protein